MEFLNICSPYSSELSVDDWVNYADAKWADFITGYPERKLPDKVPVFLLIKLFQGFCTFSVKDENSILADRAKLLAFVKKAMPGDSPVQTLSNAFSLRFSVDTPPTKAVEEMNKYYSKMGKEDFPCFLLLRGYPESIRNQALAKLDEAPQLTLEEVSKALTTVIKSHKAQKDFTSLSKQMGGFSQLQQRERGPMPQQRTTTTTSGTSPVSTAEQTPKKPYHGGKKSKPRQPEMEKKPPSNQKRDTPTRTSQRIQDRAARGLVQTWNKDGTPKTAQEFVHNKMLLTAWPTDLKEPQHAEDHETKKERSSHLASLLSDSDIDNRAVASAVVKFGDKKLPCTALIDTGADRSFISPLLVAQLAVELHPENISVITAASTVRAEHSVSVELRIGSIRKQVSLLVLSSLADHIIIGTDLFHAFGFSLMGLPFLPPSSSDSEDELSDIENNIPDQPSPNMTDRPKVDSDVQCLLQENLQITGPARNTCVTLDVDPSFSDHAPEVQFDEIRAAALLSQVQLWMASGVIEESPSPNSCTSRVVIVPKRGNKWRCCLDFRVLNRHLRYNGSSVMPKVEDLIRRFGPFAFASVIDLSESFLQLNIAEQSRRYLGFLFRGKAYRFCRLPFGLWTAPFLLQDYLNDILAPLQIQSYLDDIGAGHSTLELHLGWLKSLLRILNANNIRINHEKSQLVLSEVRYLGFVLDREGVRPDPEKVSAIVHAERPSTKKGVQSFIGMVTFHCQFIPQFSSLVRRVNSVIQPNNRVRWNPDAVAAFQELQSQFVKGIGGRYLDFSKPIHLFTDSSDTDASGWLGVEIDKKVYPVMVFSRRFSPAQQRWPIYRKEFYAIVLALQRWPFLKFTTLFVHVDNAALVRSLSKPDLSDFIWRKIRFLQSFRLITIWEPHNDMADHLTRHSRVDSLTATQAESADLVTPSEEDRMRLLRSVHSKGHFGVPFMIRELRSRGYWWPFIQNDCTNVVNHCEACLRYNVFQKYYFPSPEEESSSLTPMALVAFDLLEVHTSYCLVAVDYFSGFVWLRAIPNKKATSVAAALHQIFTTFGFPMKVKSDAGKEFLNEILDELFRTFGVERSEITPYFHSSNGKVERYNRIVLDVLRKMTNGDLHDWQRNLDFVQLAINCRRDSSEFSPFEKMFFRPHYVSSSSTDPPIPIPPSDHQFSSLYANVAKLVPLLQASLQESRLKKSAELNHQRRVTHVALREGDKVMARNLNRQSKQESWNEGPFIVHRVVGNSYDVEDNFGNLFRYNRSDLRLISEDIELDQNLEVKKIVGHRYSDSQDVDYLVQTRSSPDPIWLPAKDIQAPQALYTYWRRQK